MIFSKLPKIFLGPMSANVVKAVCKVSKSDEPIALIPSRRQVEYDGGYVNNWSTKEFVKFVRKSNDSVILQRDHGGSKQGKTIDDGLLSYKEDSDCDFDLIHVDPWKGCSSIQEGIEKTCADITYINSCNEKVFYEIGTEQAIYEYSHEELEYFISKVFENIGSLKHKILFAVIQSGTKIISNTNVGEYDSLRLKKMLDVCKAFSLKSKEHNGDYLNDEGIRDRFEKGLDAINIAPEMGFNETKFLLSLLKEKDLKEQIEKWYHICLESGKWEKWVESPKDERDKEKIISVAGHYVFAYPEFQEIKDSIGDTNLEQKIVEHHCIKIKALANSVYGRV